MLALHVLMLCNTFTCEWLVYEFDLESNWIVDNSNSFDSGELLGSRMIKVILSRVLPSAMSLKRQRAMHSSFREITKDLTPHRCFQ